MMKPENLRRWTIDIRFPSVLCDNDTALPLAKVPVTSYGLLGLYVIILSTIGSKLEILRLLWDIVVFRLVSYLLNMICLIKRTTFIQNCIYTNFRINWTQFYINFSRKGHQINVLYVSFNAWDSQVSSYTPFHFSFTVPLKLGRFYCAP